MLFFLWSNPCVIFKISFFVFSNVIPCLSIFVSLSWLFSSASQTWMFENLLMDMLTQILSPTEKRENLFLLSSPALEISGVSLSF